MGAERIQLLTDKRRRDLAADWRLGRHAVSIDPDRRVALLDDDSAATYDALVVATGVRPRKLPSGRIAGVLVLRTHEDAKDIRRALKPGCRLVLVGGGFLGLAVAAIARRRGATVTVIEQQPEPLKDQLGPGAAGRLLELHRAQGVDVRTGLTVARCGGRPSTSTNDPERSTASMLSSVTEALWQPMQH